MIPGEGAGMLVMEPLDRARARGETLGSLAGLPFIVKDQIDVAGYATTAGTPALRHYMPSHNAVVVDTLVRSGAIVFAKANMHELAFGITSNNGAFGPVRNPYDQTRIPGGSSGGNGAAIAARLAPGGIGTDTGGSVRIPAALNGIVALRPTIHRYPQAGVTPISHTRDTVGPMARGVADLVLLDGVITGDSRHVDMLWPLWNVLDLTPDGRGADFYPELRY